MSKLISRPDDATRQAAVLFVQIESPVPSVTAYGHRHFDAARKMGFACLTAVMRPAGSTGGAEPDGDEVWPLETLTVDALLALLERLDGRYDIKAIFCHAGQASMLGEVGAIVAEVCRLTGRAHSDPAAVAACNNKFLMRSVLQRHGVRSVRHALCSDAAALREAAAEVGYPLIAKPPYGAGSAFTARCWEEGELSGHYHRFTSQRNAVTVADFFGAPHEIHLEGAAPVRYAPGESILLEEYIEGIEGSVECVIVDDVPYPVLVHEKLILTEKRGTVLENLLIAPPVSFTAAQTHAIKQYAVECLTALGLRNAIVHLEFRLTAEGPVVIEINPRLGGLYVDAAFRDIAGLDPYALYVALLTGADGLHERLRDACAHAAGGRQHYAMFALFPEHSGRFEGFEGLDVLTSDPAIIDFAVACPEGSAVQAEIEESYLLKGWAAVDGRAHALRLYGRLVGALKPVVVPFPHSPKREVMTIEAIIDTLSRNRFCHAPAFAGMIRHDADDQLAFARHWDRLATDENFISYTRRERRLLRYRFTPGQPLQIDRNPDFKPAAVYDVDYTPGLNRLTYAEDSFIHSAILRQILDTDIAILENQLHPEREYTIEIHQFRVFAEGGAVSPTTSGIHQDGLDWVCMHFIGSRNIQPVLSELHASKESAAPLWAHVLDGFLDTVIVDDAALFHSASAVRQANPDERAFRDMLLVSFRGAERRA